MLKVENISVKIGNNQILKDISFEIAEKDILMLIGPNGAGKTTLIKAIMNNLKHTGKACLKGTDISKISPLELARQIGVLTQKNTQQFSYTVEEVVSLGRYAHQKGIFGSLSPLDKEKIEKGMTLTGIWHLKDRSVLTLSGGELQRVFLAAVFAQDPDLLILDEPTNHLDLQYQISIFEIIREWVKQEGRCAIAVVHDLNAAFNYGTKALLLNEGKIESFGQVRDVLQKETLKKVYKVDVARWMQTLLEYWN